MSKTVEMNVFLHSLLVIKQMNDFTVSEAKEALLREHAEFTDGVEARKFIYRQLLRNVEKGLLERIESLDGGVTKVLYSKTEEFFVSIILPKKQNMKPRVKRARKPLRTKEEKVIKTSDYQAELKMELQTYEIDLNASLEEAKEYKRLADRFPELQEKIQQHQSQAKTKSIKLLGKINALQNLLGHKITDHQSC